MSLFSRLYTGLLLACFCAAANASIDIAITSKSGTPVQLDQAIVYAVAHTIPTDSAPQTEATIVQRDLQFDPYISVIQRNTQVIFPNRDNTSHHVYSFSPAKSFELPLYKKQLPGPVLFDKSGLVVLGCNIHDWMLAYLLVVDTPFFTQLSEGNQQLVDVPPGKYQLHLWHPRLHKKDLAPVEVEVVEGQPLTATFKLTHKLKSAFRPEAPGQQFDDDNY
ncbi:methylamine utilization protein [Porticoccus sp. W117]|uniref:methylamine utilization protein n=1 Tax=Porticoccus sp. W117 TaxID=3054777 RepID=UPI00259599FD|nr:methylamine utilization protein [Porticoccus sp. W117]MDM3870206.1 methylamine utilization protein [Porticoccus sp. W117]